MFLREGAAAIEVDRHSGEPHACGIVTGSGRRCALMLACAYTAAAPLLISFVHDHMHLTG